MRAQLRSMLSRSSDYALRQKGRLDESPIGRRPAIKWAVLLLLAVVLLWYPVGMAVYYEVDDDVNYRAGVAAPPGGSKAIETAALLVERETEHWAPNKPFWHPAAALSNMPNFQLGLMYAVSRFAVEMGDQIGRTRGSSAIDPDLDKAAGLLRYDGTRWHMIMSSIRSENQYRQGAAALHNYNLRLSQGTAVFDQRADNLIALLDRIRSDLGASSAALDQRVIGSNLGPFDRQADDIYMNVKGRLYGYYVILRDIGVDFAGILEERQLTQVYDQMLASLRTAAGLYPIIISNGSEDGLLIPSHLSAQGFYLLRARTQMSEVTDVLAK